MNGLIDPKETAKQAIARGLLLTADQLVSAPGSKWPGSFIERGPIKLPAEAGVAAIPIVPKADRKKESKPSTAAENRKRYVITHAQLKSRGYWRPLW